MGVERLLGALNGEGRGWMFEIGGWSGLNGGWGVGGRRWLPKIRGTSRQSPRVSPREGPVCSRVSPRFPAFQNLQERTGVPLFALENILDIPCAVQNTDNFDRPQ